MHVFNGNIAIIATFSQKTNILSHDAIPTPDTPTSPCRKDSGATASLADGLSRLRENAVQLARQGARDIVNRIGQMGGRRLAAVG